MGKAAADVSTGKEPFYVLPLSAKAKQNAMSEKKEEDRLYAGFAEWVGREVEEHDVVDANAIRGLMATIASDATNPIAHTPAPLLAHWTRFLPYTALNQIGEDGHPRRGDFLPDIDLPRRMWAGSTVRFERDLLVGEKVTRRSTIANISEKNGRSGRLIFVSVDHEVLDGKGTVLTETQDIVYREAPQPGAPSPASRPAPPDPHWERGLDASPVLLFRYSALTFNGHRIHYDRPYATHEEGYPGLVVHGPLIATLLLHEMLARHPGIDVATYRFRAVKPLFDSQPFFVCGSLATDGTAHLFARDAAGALCLDAIATLRRLS